MFSLHNYISSCHFQSTSVNTIQFRQYCVCSSSTMIRNRSQIMTTSPPNSSDIESNEKSSHKMIGGTKRWQYLIGIAVAAVMLYSLILFSSPPPLQDRKTSQASSYEQLTIVMNLHTFTSKYQNMMHGEGNIANLSHQNQLPLSVVHSFLILKRPSIIIRAAI